MDKTHKHPAPAHAFEPRDIQLLPSVNDVQADPLHFRLKAPATTLPYRVHTIGHIQDNPNHSTLGTYFDDAMLFIFLAGQGRYHLDNQTLRLHRGMIGLILPCQDPGMVVADPDDPYEHLSCRFAGDEAIKTARRIIQEQQGRSFFKVDHWHEVAEVLRRGIVLWPGREGVQPGERDRLRRVDAILAETLSCLDTTTSDGHPPLCAQALWEYMHVYISQPINLDQAAASFGVSKQHLCKVAKQQLGQSMGESWTSLKIDWAMALLLQEKMSIAQVARKVGYEDPLYFSRVFRARAGMSPRLWRTRQQNNE